MEALDILRDIMKKDGVSATELSKRSGKSLQNLCNIMKGKSPKTDTYVELARALGYKVYVTKEECNGYEVGGDVVPETEEVKSSIREEIESIKTRLDALEGMNSGWRERI